jgi:uncharacterized membrane protein
MEAARWWSLTQAGRSAAFPEPVRKALPAQRAWRHANCAAALSRDFAHLGVTRRPDRNACTGADHPRVQRCLARLGYRIELPRRSVLAAGIRLATPARPNSASTGMESRYRVFGHSIHQTVVPFAVGLLGAAACFDGIALVIGRPGMAEMAYWLISGGLVVGILAAPFGFLDWMNTPDGSRAESLGRLHGVLNVVVLLLFWGSWMMRRGDPAHPEVIATVLSFAAVALTLITAWMGGELVTRLGMGVFAAAGPNASSSLHNGSGSTAPVIASNANDADAIVTPAQTVRDGISSTYSTPP